MGKKPKLALVGATPATALPPPATLGKAGAKLRHAVQTEYRIGDSGGVETLAQRCNPRTTRAE